VTRRPWCAVKRRPAGAEADPAPARFAAMPSSVIRSFSYDPDEQRLRVTFVSGRRYAYHEVPADVAEEMDMAFSKGTYFNRKIRDHFDCTREA
jgi:hypothetical protein